MLLHWFNGFGYAFSLPHSFDKAKKKRKEKKKLIPNTFLLSIFSKFLFYIRLSIAWHNSLGPNLDKLTWIMSLALEALTWRGFLLLYFFL